MAKLRKIISIQNVFCPILWKSHKKVVNLQQKKYMRQYLDILDDVLESREMNWGLTETGFTTSADVVMEASGLRFEAIRVIAREQGVEIEDTSCRCIDESLLDALADAHVRKMRAYFNNAKRHIAELDGDELATFINFCQTFNNRQSSDSAAQTWSDIDTDAIREQFIQKVHELTPSPAYCRLFAGSSFFVERIISSLSSETRDSLDTFVYKQRCEAVERILNSHLFYEKPSKTEQPCIDIRSVVWRVTLPARYHIHISEDDDHLQDAIDNRVINRAPAMVA